MQFLLKLSNEKSFLRLFILGISSFLLLACDQRGAVDLDQIDIRDMRRVYSIERSERISDNTVFKARFLGCSPRSEFDSEYYSELLDLFSFCIDRFSVRLESPDDIQLNTSAMTERYDFLQDQIHYEEIITGDLADSYTFELNVEDDTTLETKMPGEFLSDPSIEITKVNDEESENALVIKIQASRIEDTNPYEEVWTSARIGLHQDGVWPHIRLYKSRFDKDKFGEDDEDPSITFSDGKFIINITKEESEKNSEGEKLDFTKDIRVDVNFRQGVKVKEERSVFFPARVERYYLFDIQNI